jgi:hypothetical protein
MTLLFMLKEKKLSKYNCTRNNIKCKGPTIYPARMGGGYGFLFCSEMFFRTTQEFDLFCFVVQSANFFPEFNIRLYDKNSESDYFFFSTKIRIIFSATLGIRIFF